MSTRLLARHTVALTDAQVSAIQCDSPVYEPVELLDRDEIMFRAAFFDGGHVSLDFLGMMAGDLRDYCVSMGNALDLQAEDAEPGHRAELRRSSVSWFAISKKLLPLCWTSPCSSNNGAAQPAYSLRVEK
jgi:hypothetical protein